ncbi:MAG: hypothetical protein NXI31_12935 [bacterium]|nr:hypothetical protein [bacterium]
MTLLLLAVTCGWLAARGGPWLLLIWPTLAFGLVALAYCVGDAHWFGKRPDGRWRKGPRFVVLLPFLLLSWSCWWLLRAVSREPPHARLSSECWIGRRVVVTELPAEVAAVVDLTAELVDSAAVCRGRDYVAQPLLDGVGASPERLVEVVDSLAAVPRPFYLHCAQGHGRTAMVAAAWLLRTRQAATVDDALARIRAARPLARPSRSQRRALVALAGATPG